MIGLTGRNRVFAYDGPCDMRKSFNTLSGLVFSMGHEVAEGDVFLFVARNRKRAKVLWYDGTGLCLLAKRLDQGLFAVLWDEGPDTAQLTMNELGLFLEGCKVVGKMPLSPPPIDRAAASQISPAAFA